MFEALLDSYKPFVLQKELLAWEGLGMCVGCPRKNYGVDNVFKKYEVIEVINDEKDDCVPCDECHFVRL